MSGRVLLTGANGFIGRAAIAPLLRRGFEVHALARHRIDAPAVVQWHLLDLLSSGEDLAALIAMIQPDYLLHFAWYAEPGKYWQAKENVDWLRASLRLLQTFQAVGGRRVAIAGTCAEYDWTVAGPLREDSPRRPATLYGVCKNALQEVLTAYAAQHGLSSAWGRIFFPYGPHEPATRLIPDVIGALSAGRPARCSSGAQVRDFMHVDDVGEAFAALLASSLTGAANIGSGRGVRVGDVAMMIGERLGRPDLVALGALPDRKDDPPSLVADIHRLRDELGVTPRPIEEGLAATIASWRG